MRCRFTPYIIRNADVHPYNTSKCVESLQQAKHFHNALFKQKQCRLKVYPGLELRAQPGLSSLPGSPLCLQLALVLLDVIVLHTITKVTLASTHVSQATTAFSWCLCSLMSLSCTAKPQLLWQAHWEHSQPHAILY